MRKNKDKQLTTENQQPFAPDKLAQQLSNRRMPKLEFKYYVFLASLLLIVLLFMVLFIVSLDKTEQKEGSSLTTVKVIGEFSVNNRDWHTFSGSGKEIPAGTREVWVRGNFNKDIDGSTDLIVSFYNIIGNIKINNETVCDFGRTGTYPSYLKSPGSEVFFINNGLITKDDKVEMYLKNPYAHNNAQRNEIRTFFSDLVSGTNRDFLRDVFSKQWVFILGGAFMLLLGILVFLIAISLVWRMKRREIMTQLFSFAFLSVVAGGYTIIQSLSRELSMFYDNAVLNNILTAGSTYLLGVSICIYACMHMRTRRLRNMAIFGTILLIFLCEICLITQIVGFADLSETRDMFFAFVVINAMFAIVCFCYEAITDFGLDSMMKVLSFSPLFITIMLEVINMSLELWPQGLTLKIGTFVLVLVRLSYLIAMIIHNIKEEERMLEMEFELKQDKILLSLSQIQPHFIYNVLTTIKDLCIRSPHEAEEAINCFSMYLRSNLEAMSDNQFNTLKDELESTQLLVDLERLRFGDRVRYETDIGVAEFYVPSLTLEPIVENAIRHGITKRKQGGTVKISTRENAKEYQIVVQDDGIGFDTNDIDDDPVDFEEFVGSEPSKSKRNNRHIGIMNVKERVEAQCSGTLTLESEPSKGTTVTILIPKNTERIDME